MNLILLAKSSGSEARWNIHENFALFKEGDQERRPDIP